MRQRIGIPMGIDPAPFREKYISILIGSNKIKARKFHAVKRFIDDILALNDGGEFGRNHNNIYPVELELKLKHSCRDAIFLVPDLSEGAIVLKPVRSFVRIFSTIVQ